MAEGTDWNAILELLGNAGTGAAGIVTGNPLMAIPALMRMGYGGYELLKSSQYAEAERPKYQIPSAIKEAVGNQRGLASDRTAISDSLMPFLQKTLADKTRSDRNLAYGTGQLLGSTQESYGKNVDAMSRANLDDYTNWASLNQMLNNMLIQGLAPEENKQWAWDEQMPYQDSMETAKDLRQVGIKNMMYGADTIPYLMGNGEGGGIGSWGKPSTKQTQDPNIPANPNNPLYNNPNNYLLNPQITPRMGQFESYFRPKNMDYNTVLNIRDILNPKNVNTGYGRNFGEV